MQPSSGFLQYQARHYVLERLLEPSQSPYTVLKTLIGPSTNQFRIVFLGAEGVIQAFFDDVRHVVRDEYALRTSKS